MSKGALSLSQAETYYDEKYARDDYYTEDRTVEGEWFGRAAAALGLTGTAARTDFTAILRGVDPRSGIELVAKAQGREQRRAGWDATFSAPKSVSIQALLGDDPRLIEAHREAVTAALGELQTYAQARRRRGQEWVITANFAAVQFDHLAARPWLTGCEKGYAPDPQLHTHVVIANLTQRPDGAWRSLEPLEISARKAGRRRWTGPILQSACKNWATASSSPAVAANGSSPRVHARSDHGVFEPPPGYRARTETAG